VNIGLAVGLVAGGIGIIIAIVAVIVTLHARRRTESFGGNGRRTFRGWSSARSGTLGTGSPSSDPTAATEPLGSDTFGSIGTDGPPDADAAPGQAETAGRTAGPPASSWARGGFGEQGRTQKGGRAGATAPGMRIWYAAFVVIVIVGVAAAATGGFGLAHPIVVLGTGLGVVVVLAAAFFVVYGRHRAAAWSSLAADHGWQYSPADDALTQRWSGPPFGQGTLRNAANVITGTSGGAEFTAFDYTYDLTSRNQQSSSIQSYSVVVRHLGRAVPNIQFTPAGVLGRAAHLGQDQFDQVWQVAMPDDASAVLLTTPVRDWLMEPNHRRLALRIEGSDLLTWQDGSLAPEALPAVLATLAEFADIVMPA